MSSEPATTTEIVPQSETDVPPRPSAPTSPAAMSTANKKRPRLDLNVDGVRERKRGKSMFGILLGTLNKAKIEDKERNASEAAKKRHMIEQRLQNKLRKETDTVRRAEEAKKDKTLATRKEEELQLKDSIYKLRRTRLPLLSSFLLTSDDISSDNSSLPSKDPLVPPPRSHPPPLYYLPAILLPIQEEFLKRRQAEVQDAVEKEWAAFCVERVAGIQDIGQLRQRAAESEEQAKAEQRAAQDVEADKDMDTGIPTDDAATDNKLAPREGEQDIEMRFEPEEAGKEGKGDGENVLEQDSKDESVPMQADDDEVVEY